MRGGVPTLNDIRAAHVRVCRFAHRTPLLSSCSLNELLGATVLLKCENLQKAGAFKFRGATNAVQTLIQRHPHTKAVATHSSGKNTDLNA